MQRRICPICDHVMKSSHYCRFCKRWISNPHIINATYYLNECHEDHELNEKKQVRKSFEPDLLYEKKLQNRKIPDLRMESGRPQNGRIPDIRMANGRQRNGRMDPAAAGKIFHLIMMIIAAMVFLNILLPILFIIL